MYSYILLLHVLGATVWTGGHLVLSLSVLPKALRESNPSRITEFESLYEKIGMPALALQLITGVWMALTMQSPISTWFTSPTPQSNLILLKLSLLLLTILTALDARLRIFPTLSAETLPKLARRIVLVTLLSVAFVLAGVSFRGELLFGLL